MYRKSSVFASSSSAIASKTEADYRQGMVPNTVAMAEDVNAYGLNSDEMNWTMSQELCNLIEDYGITLGSARVADPTNAANKMLLKLFREKLPVSRCLTGVMGPGMPYIEQVGGDIVVAFDFKVRFNNSVYYANTDNNIPTVTILAQTFSVSNSWANGVYYLYATSAGALAAQQTPVLGSEGATKCMLGSFFVYNGTIQSGSWKYQPWLCVSSVERRESPTAYTKGGYMTAASSSTLQMGTLEVQAEGINAWNNSSDPNIMTVQAVNPFTYKALYTGYNPGTSAISEIGGSNAIDVGTHVYDMTNNLWSDITTWASGFADPKYIVVVPCITPTGQTLMIPAMSTRDNVTGDYASVFDSQTEAAEAVFGLQYSGLDTVAARAIYLGISLVLRVPTTNSPLDLTNPGDLMVVGRVPQALAGFTSAAGQSGGGTGAYIPMKSYYYDGTYQAVTVNNNAVSNIEGSTVTAVAVTLPNATSGIMNQVMIHYSHTATKNGLSFSGVTWWFNRQPSYESGYTYEIILDYINGHWYAGYLMTATAV